MRQRPPYQPRCHPGSQSSRCSQDRQYEQDSCPSYRKCSDDAAKNRQDCVPCKNCGRFPSQKPEY